MELSAQVFCVTDLTGTVVWCNASFERALSVGPRRLLGIRLQDIVHPDDRDVLRQAESRLREQGELGPTKLRMRTADGGWRWLEWTTRVDVTRQRVYGAARDITERRGAEAALSDSASRLRAIMKHSPSIMFVKDLEGRYLVVNDGFARATGVAADQAVGLCAQECWPQDFAVIREREQMLFGDGTSLVSDERMHTVDGPRDFMVSRFLLRDERGAPYAVGGIATDVTDRLSVERALADRDKLLDSVIKASPDMITLMDGVGKIHQISEARSAVFGYPYEVFTGTDLFDFVHPDDRDDVASVFVRLATGAITHHNLRYRVCHADGHWVTVDSRAQAVLDAEGRFAAAVVVSRDITSQLESEHLLEESRAAVEQASRAKSDFLSRMSHELRTPLNSILGFAQLLQMDDLPAPQADAVAHILRAGRHLLDLIDEVLDIARIESGHLELALMPVPVFDIVREAIDLTNPMAARAEVVIRTAFDGRDRHVVLADRQRLMQVLLNVLSNAVKYNRPGGRVEVSCSRTEGGFVRLAVADTGRGIRSEDMDRVFLPFDRLGVEQTGIEGTGVGLALSLHLCERMGGRLEVDSVHEVGSTFFVDLPALDTPGEAELALGAGTPARSNGTAGVGASAGADAGAGAGAPGDLDAVGSTAPALESEVGTGTARAEVGSTASPGDARDWTSSDTGTGSVNSADAGEVRVGSAGPVAGRTFRVLLVEDNLSTLDLLERVLSRRPGTEVLAAMQGGLGAELAREHRPDLILLDLQLPDMAGTAVLDRLAEDPLTAAIPIAVVGTDASPQQVRQLLGRGVIGFLARPIDVRGLLSLVDAVRAARG
jgi:PAS domain S-box-containing protein